jgi:hypothetical protein
MSAILKFQQCRIFATTALKTINEVATKMAIKAQGVRDSRSLTKGQRANLEDIVTYALAVLNPDVPISEDLVYDVLKSDDAVFSTEKCKRIVALYQSEAGNASTKEERFELICNAYAAINADLLEDLDEEASGTPRES